MADSLRSPLKGVLPVFFCLLRRSTRVMFPARAA